MNPYDGKTACTNWYPATHRPTDHIHACARKHRSSATAYTHRCTCGYQWVAAPTREEPHT